MRKIIMLLVIITLSLSGCSSQKFNTNVETEKFEENTISNLNKDDIKNEETIEFKDLSDPKLTDYIEETVYHDVVLELNSDNYLIENVSSIYISKEYIGELTSNSQENIYFGYTLSELELVLGEEKYIFTCDNSGQTIIEPYVKYDDTFEEVVKNIAIGSGVILLCVTISTVSGGLGDPAVSMVFAMSAKTGTTVALSSGMISGAISAVLTGYQTNSIEQTLKNCALAASEGFKWGAITGTLSGGVLEINALRGATLNGLTIDEAALIQKESGYSIDIIKQFHSVDEYKIYKQANLYTKNVNGEVALVRDIDLNYKSEFIDGTMKTNLERMSQGYSPVDPTTGKVYQLHHIGQKSDGALSILTEAEHQGNATILNITGKLSEIDRSAFSTVRKQFWKSFAESY